MNIAMKQDTTKAIILTIAILNIAAPVSLFIWSKNLLHIISKLFLLALYYNSIVNHTLSKN